MVIIDAHAKPLHCTCRLRASRSCDQPVRMARRTHWHKESEVGAAEERSPNSKVGSSSSADALEDAKGVGADVDADAGLNSEAADDFISSLRAAVTRMCEIIKLLHKRRKSFASCWQQL